MWADGHNHDARCSNNAGRWAPGARSTDIQRTKLGLVLGCIPSAENAGSSHNPSRVEILGVENAESCVYLS